MSKVAKKLYFNIDGIGRVYAMPGATFDTGGEKRDAVIADGGVAGFSEETVAPSVQFKLPNLANMDLNQLRNLTNVNVNVQDDNGKSWVIRSAWVSEPPKLSGGEIDIQMSGIAAYPVN